LQNKALFYQPPVKPFSLSSIKAGVNKRKTRIMKRTVIIAVMLIGSMLTATAQPSGKGQRNNEPQMERECILPNLTEEQQAKIEKLKIAHLKVRNQHQAEIAEMRATKRKLMIADKPDQKAIDAIIEKKGAKQIEMHKAAAAHHVAIRNLLTDEQKVVFDSKPMKGKRQGRHGKHEGNKMEHKGMHHNCPQNKN
jgi:Spy/CpxP family protein refolding chaperone